MRNFISADAAIAVTIQDAAWDLIVERCAAAGRTETGGVLIGRYTEWLDRVVVLEATGPPSDSRFWPSAFWRGLRGLRRLLAKRWKSGLHYVGEWHFHPFVSAQPSRMDVAQMRAFAEDNHYQCPRPILVVIGGDPAGDPEVAVAVIDGDALLRLEPRRLPVG